MSRFIVCALASALALTTAGQVFAAPDTTAPTSGPMDPAPAAAAQDPAQTPAQAAAAKAAAAAAAKKKADADVICKPDSGTGSRVGGMKICMTRKEWRERQD